MAANLFVNSTISCNFETSAVSSKHNIPFISLINAYLVVWTKRNATATEFYYTSVSGATSSDGDFPSFFLSNFFN